MRALSHPTTPEPSRPPHKATPAPSPEVPTLYCTALNREDMDRGLAQKRLVDAHDRLNGSVMGILADRHHLSLTTTDSLPTTHFISYRVPTSPPQPFASTPWLPHPPRYPPLSVLHPQPSPHTSCLERMKPAPRTPSSASPSSATRYGKKHPLLVPFNLRRLLLLPSPACSAMQLVVTSSTAPRTRTVHDVRIRGPSLLRGCHALLVSQPRVKAC